MKRRDVLRVQGTYYVVSGLFPLISMKGFERLTGTKFDRWLVQMVGLLAISIGAATIVAGWDENRNGSAIVLSVSSALSFAAIDTVHAVRGRISPIYLIDAAIEVAILACLVATTET